MAASAGQQTLIPTSRFGQLLRESRVAHGRSLDDLARRTDGRYTASQLESIEFGEVRVDEEELGALAELYQVAVGSLTPRRAKLVIDLDDGTIASGSAAAEVDDPTDADEVLGNYLSLVYALRGIEPGEPIPLRDLDVATLARALDRPPDDIERRLEARMVSDAPEVARRTSLLRRRIIVPAAGVLVAATAIGVLVFVQASDDDAPSPAPASPAVTTVDDLFTPVEVEPGETSVEVPPIVYERDDPADPIGVPSVPGE